jgi:hypothetical protein
MRIREAKKRIERHLQPANDPEPELPQILQHPMAQAAEPRTAPLPDRGPWQALAPVILTVSRLLVGVLMSASFIDLSRVPGLAWLGEKPRPRLAVPATRPLQAAAATDNDSPRQTAAAPAQPPISLDELALLERCEGLIAAGDMAAARLALAQAAEQGSVNARFALAETYDPNVLAAWGLRDRIADVAAARSLYEQARAGGDPRAETRISALRADGQ